jgi:hypothetical protein
MDSAREKSIALPNRKQVSSAPGLRPRTGFREVLTDGQDGDGGAIFGGDGIAGNDRTTKRLKRERVFLLDSDGYVWGSEKQRVVGPEVDPLKSH